MITFLMLMVLWLVSLAMGILIGICFAESKSKETKPLVWKTSEYVLKRLQDASTTLPKDHRNILLKDNDVLRIVLLSDLQELLSHAGIKIPKSPTQLQNDTYLKWWNERLTKDKNVK